MVRIHCFFLTWLNLCCRTYLEILCCDIVGIDVSDLELSLLDGAFHLKHSAHDLLRSRLALLLAGRLLVSLTLICLSLHGKEFVRLRFINEDSICLDLAKIRNNLIWLALSVLTLRPCMPPCFYRSLFFNCCLLFRAFCCWVRPISGLRLCFATFMPLALSLLLLVICFFIRFPGPFWACICGLGVSCPLTC